SDPIRVLPQEGSEKLFLPDLPGTGIFLRGPGMLGGAPEVFPSLATLVDPQGGVAAAADALGAFDKVMRHKPGELQQAACFGLTENLLELLDVDPWFEVIFVNTDDAPHAWISPVTFVVDLRQPRPPLRLTPAVSSRGERMHSGLLDCQ